MINPHEIYDTLTKAFLDAEEKKIDPAHFIYPATRASNILKINKAHFFSSAQREEPITTDRELSNFIHAIEAFIAPLTPNPKRFPLFYKALYEAETKAIFERYTTQLGYLTPSSPTIDPNDLEQPLISDNNVPFSHLVDGSIQLHSQSREKK